MKVSFGANRRPALRRERPFAQRNEIDPIFTKRSLGVLVQFQDLLMARIRKRTFAGDNQF